MAIDVGDAIQVGKHKNDPHRFSVQILSFQKLYIIIIIINYKNSQTSFRNSAELGKNQSALLTGHSGITVKQHLTKDTFSVRAHKSPHETISPHLVRD